MKIWKLFWDLTSVIIGLYLGYKTFLLSGSNIPMFGYFPIGVILGLLVLGVCVPLIHLVEGIIATIVYKITGVRLEEKLPFD